MSPPFAPPTAQVDEIGLTSARHGDFLLRSTFRLVFRRERAVLRAAMAEGNLYPSRQGKSVPLEMYASCVGRDAFRAAARLGMALHLANHDHIYIDDLDHLLSLGDDDGQAWVRELAGFLEEAELKPARLLCVIGGVSPHDLSRLAADLRSLGVRVAAGARGEPVPQAIRAVRPELVRVDGGWFRLFSHDAEACRLLSAFIDRLRGEGIGVLIDGIDTAEQLLQALAVGADFLQGDALACSQLAGMEPPAAEIALAGESAVVRLPHAG